MNETYYEVTICYLEMISPKRRDICLLKISPFNPLEYNRGSSGGTHPPSSYQEGNVDTHRSCTVTLHRRSILDRKLGFSYVDVYPVPDVWSDAGPIPYKVT